MSKRNVFEFVPNKHSGDINSVSLLLNGKSVAGSWTDEDQWRILGDRGRVLVFWYTDEHNGFSYNLKDAKRNMLSLTKYEIERVRKSRYRK